MIRTPGDMDRFRAVRCMNEGLDGHWGEVIQIRRPPTERSYGRVISPRISRAATHLRDCRVTVSVVGTLRLLFLGLMCALAACAGNAPGPVAHEAWDPLVALSRPSDDDVAFIGFPQSVGDTEPDLVFGGRAINPVGESAIAFTWMPNGKDFLLTHAGDLGGTNPDRMSMISPAGEVVREVKLDIARSGGWGRLAVDPSATYVVWPNQNPSRFQESFDLWAADLETGETKRLTETPDIAESEPLFISDNQLLLIANGRVARMNLDNGALTYVTPSSQTAATFDVDPSENWVVYSAYLGNDRIASQIWTVPIDGSTEPSVLIDDPRIDPRVSSDGMHLLVREIGTPPDSSRLDWIALPTQPPWMR